MANMVHTNTMPSSTQSSSQPQIVPDMFQTYNFIASNSSPEIDYKMLTTSLQKGDSNNLGLLINNAGVAGSNWGDVTNTTTDSVTIPVTSGGFSLPLSFDNTKPKTTPTNITNVYHTEGVTIPVTLHTDPKKQINGSVFNNEFGTVQSAFAIKNEMDSLSDVGNADSDLRVHFEQEYQNYTCDFDSLQQDFNLGQTAEDDTKFFASNSVEGFPLQVITQEFDGNDNQSLQTMIKKEMYFESGQENGNSDPSLLNLKGNNVINVNGVKTSLYNGHTTNGMPPKPQYECEYCHQVFSKLTCLKVHQRIHVEERPFKCEDCHLSFSSMANLSVHQRVHASEQTGEYKCQYCGKCFAQINNLKTHEQNHNIETPYKCEICDEYFTTSNKLKIHRIIHEEIKTMMAEDAEYRASQAAAAVLQQTQQMLQQQQLNHVNQQQQLQQVPISCQKCAILNQTRAGKDGGLALKCQDCQCGLPIQQPAIINISPMSLNNLSTLQVQQQKHKSSSPPSASKAKKPFKCMECDKCFYNQEELDFHVLRHKDSKPFKCDVCGRGFSRKFNLQRHRKVHAGALPLEGLE